MDRRKFIEESSGASKNSIISQYGLYSESPDEIKQLIKRIDKFNLNNLGFAVKANIMEQKEGDELCPHPHIKVVLQFPSREIQERFWTS